MTVEALRGHRPETLADLLAPGRSPDSRVLELARVRRRTRPCGVRARRVRRPRCRR